MKQTSGGSRGSFECQIENSSVSLLKMLFVVDIRGCPINNLLSSLHMLDISAFFMRQGQCSSRRSRLVLLVNSFAAYSVRSSRDGQTGFAEHVGLFWTTWPYETDEQFAALLPWVVARVLSRIWNPNECRRRVCFKHISNFLFLPKISKQRALCSREPFFIHNSLFYIRDTGQAGW